MSLNFLARLAARLLAVPLPSGLLAVTAQPAQAALSGRDINGNPVPANDAAAVFEYDPDLDITWLRNWNAGAGSAFDNGANTTDGLMTWANASAWAASLTVGAFGGWRLPTTLQPDPTCSGQFNAGAPYGVQSYAYDCTGSAAGHVWYAELVRHRVRARTHLCVALQCFQRGSERVFEDTRGRAAW